MEMRPIFQIEKKTKFLSSLSTRFVKGFKLATALAIVTRAVEYRLKTYPQPKQNSNHPKIVCRSNRDAGKVCECVWLHE